jgi:DNA-binding transcriptional MerR regulator
VAVTGGKGRGQDGAPDKAAGGSRASASGDDQSAAGHGGTQYAGDHFRSEPYHGEQGLLFEDELDTHPEDTGYRGPTACAAAGISYRQLDYWARTGLVEPSVRSAHGSGSQRLYGFRDILVLKVVKRLLDTGISLQQIRAAVRHLRDHGAADLAQVTLMSDGVSVYECTSPDEVVDLLQGGQGVFGIALGRVWREVEGTLAELPAEKTSDTRGVGGSATTAASDDLANRRARRTG